MNDDAHSLNIAAQPRRVDRALFFHINFIHFPEQKHLNLFLSCLSAKHALTSASQDVRRMETLNYHEAATSLRSSALNSQTEH